MNQKLYKSYQDLQRVKVFSAWTRCGPHLTDSLAEAEAKAERGTARGMLYKYLEVVVVVVA